MKKKIIIIGSSGMAGHVISSVLRMSPDTFEVLTVSRTNDITNPSVLMDVTDFKALSALIHDQVPYAVINCIGILNKTAEDNPDLAVLINSYLPHFLEAVTKNTQTKVIHISTDCVFSGSKGGYFENDLKDGVGFYAQSKAIGEVVNNKDLTIRTSIIGPELKQNGIGLLHWFLHQKGTLNGYTNAFWSGVTTLQLAKSIVQILDTPELTGLVHLTNNEKISKYDLLGVFKEVFNRTAVEIKEDVKYKVDKSLINTREDFKSDIPSYALMMEEMKQWMYRNAEIYSQYSL